MEPQCEWCDCQQPCEHAAEEPTWALLGVLVLLVVIGWATLWMLS